MAASKFSSPSIPNVSSPTFPEPTNMLDVRAILWLENYLQVSGYRCWSRSKEGLPLRHWWGGGGCWKLISLPNWACHPVTPQTWPSTILVVSHDRNFLNAIATDIIHLHSQRLDGYRGDFETFIKSKQKRLLNQQREYEAQQQYRQHIQVWGQTGLGAHGY